MDFLDPKNQRRHNLMILVGYALVSIAVLIATVILVYLVYGFGFNKKGEVIQNGLMFVSSTPGPANIYLNGVLNKAQTDSRIILPEGQYVMQLMRSGYRTWQRNVQINGGKVVHFDYPFLFPVKLTSTVEKTYDIAPTFTSSSLDKRWLLVARPGEGNQLELFDLKDPKAVVSTLLVIPQAILTPATSTQTWQVVEWSNDDKHVVLRHVFDAGSEYILLDRSAPEKSVNLTQTLGVSPSELQLIDKKYDKYYLYDATKQTLSKATLVTPVPVVYLEHVLAFKSYSDDTMLYAASPLEGGDGLVKIMLVQAGKSYTIRQFPAGGTYLVDLAAYKGDMYVAAGATNDNRVYIYKNPVDQINNKTLKRAAPIRALRVTTPNYLSFSANTRFIVAESGANFAVYDAEDDKGFNYKTTDSLDAPQVHATWMDGHRLVYVSNGEAVVFDYDYQNRQALVADRPEYVPAFDGSYKYLYTLMPDKITSAKLTLSQTPLLTKADQ